MSRSSRVFSRDFKLSAIHRMLSGGNVSALARELGVLRKDLYKWRDSFRAWGPEGLRGRGRPRQSASADPAAAVASRAAPDDLRWARQRIEDLERKIGRQQMELDFFRQALRQVRASRQPSARPGVRSSTAKSGR